MTEEQLALLEEALELEKKRSEEYVTKLKYLQADFENFKKRVDRHLEETKKYCAERIVIKLLEIVDELELAVASAHSSGSTNPIVQGVEMTLQKLKKILEAEGVFPIDCLDKPFDPTRHSAIGRVEKEGIKECTVIEEIRKGYIMKEKVIRPSIVKIAVGSTSKTEERGENA
ncbi:nucleotide exchange factor GrpE [Candidatus Bathyarchaeota archaeon]|nr:nucleotide exchange factor GrpE [Candidatus Bathyarchaeota archaeon]